MRAACNCQICGVSFVPKGASRGLFCSRACFNAHVSAQPRKLRTPEQRTLDGMIQRCTNPNVEQFPNYGGRGIRVCERWLESFDAFLADMGPRPSAQHSIERKDSDGDYEPSNCCWATMTEQQRNRRNNRVVTYRGETMCVAELAERHGKDARLVAGRLQAGWTIDKAMDTPPVFKHRRLSVDDLNEAAWLVSEGVAQADVAKQMGVSQSGISKALKRLRRTA